MQTPLRAKHTRVATMAGSPCVASHAASCAPVFDGFALADVRFRLRTSAMSTDSVVFCSGVSAALETGAPGRSGPMSLAKDAASWR